MTEKEEAKAFEMGKLIATTEALKARIARLETGVLGVIGALVYAWASSRGLL